jgi:putative flippase GtrA
MTEKIITLTSAKGSGLLWLSLRRFAVVGLFVLLVENAVVYLLLELLNRYVLVRAIASFIALILSYWLNTKFSFQSTYSIGRFFSFTAGVLLSQTVSYVVSLTCFYLIFNSSRPLLATNIGALVAAGTNYSYQRFITYSGRE